MTYSYEVTFCYLLSWLVLKKRIIENGKLKIKCAVGIYIIIKS